MILESTTTDNLITEVIGIYKTTRMLGLKDISEERIEYLNELLENKSIEENTATKEVLYYVLNFIFDALALNFASNSNEKLKIEDEQFMGRKIDLRSKTREQQLDLVFQIVIQSWLQIKGSGTLKDLKTKYKHSICDYYFEKDRVKYLVECKHLNRGVSTRTNVLYEKIRDKITENQLHKTEKLMGIKATKIMFIDISEYIQDVHNFQNNFYDIKIRGLPTKYVEKFKNTIGKYVNFEEKLEQLVICWNEVIFIDERPIIFSKSGLKIGDSTDFDFDGLFIETFPMKGRERSFSEVRFRTGVIRDNYIHEIITSMNNLTSPKTFAKPDSVEIPE